MYSTILQGSGEMFHFFRNFSGQLAQARNFAEKILEKILGARILMLNILLWSLISVCPAQAALCRQLPRLNGLEIGSGAIKGFGIRRKKYLETLASAFAAQQYCAAKRVAKKLKTFKKFAFVAGSCSLLCDTDCFYCYYYPSHMSPHIYSHHYYGHSILVKFHTGFKQVGLLMRDDTGLGLLSMAICFDYRSTNIVQLIIGSGTSRVLM